jgi:hypothetical protein
VWRLVGEQQPIVLSRHFSRRYVHVVRWASNSQAFLVAASGNSSYFGTGRALDPWLCVFTIDELRVSLDLGLMNRGALTSPGASPPAGKPAHAIESPSGAILAEHFFLEEEAGWDFRKQQIWLRDAKGKTPPRLLFDYVRSAGVLFSPNEKWIAVNSNPLSDLAYVVLLRRTQDLKYEAETKADPTDKCWALFDRVSGRPISDKFHHRYVSAVRWRPIRGQFSLRLLVMVMEKGRTIGNVFLMLSGLRLQQIWHR